MHPPKATAAHVTLIGAAIDKYTSNGAAAASGMARLYTTPLVASVHETVFWPWTVVERRAKAPTKRDIAMLMGLMCRRVFEADDG